MGTFGKTSSSGLPAASHNGAVSRFTVPEDCTVTSLSVWIDDVQTSNQISVALYDDHPTTHIPNNKLYSSAGVAVSAADNGTWKTISVTNVPLTAGQIVWMGARGNSNLQSTAVYPGDQARSTLSADTISWIDPFDDAASPSPVTLSIYATYTPGITGTVYDETGRTLTISGITSASDAQAYKELQKAVALIQTITASDAQAYKELQKAVILIQTIAGSDTQAYKELQKALVLIQTVSVNDSRAYKELQRAVILIQTIAGSDAQAYKDLQKPVTLSGAIGESETQSYKELKKAVVLNGALALTDAANYIEALAEIILGSVAINDGQRYTEQLATLFYSAVTLTDRQQFLELIAAIAGAYTSVTDIKAGQILEALSLTVASQANLSDLQKYAETAGLTITGLVNMLEAGHWKDDGAVLAFVTPSIGDVGHFLEPGNMWELEAIGKNTIYEISPKTGFEISFLVFVPEQTTTNIQTILSKYEGGLLCYLSGDIINFGVSQSAIKGQWNHVYLKNWHFDALGSLAGLSVNNQPFTSTHISHNTVSHTYLFVYKNVSGFTYFFGDPGYKISKLNGDYNMGNAWQDAGKTIPANSGDNINTLETALGDAVLVSGYTPGIKRSFSQSFKAIAAVSDVGHYVDALHVTGQFVTQVMDTLIRRILEQLGVTIIAATSQSDAQGYKETLNIGVSDVTGGADVQHFVESVLANLTLVLNINDAAILAERLSLLIQSDLALTDRQKYIETLSSIISDVVALNDTYTPNDYPVARYEFIYNKSTSFVAPKIKRHFVKDRINKHIKYN